MGSGAFHPPSGVLFTFPSRYWFTIGHLGYLALERGRPSFPRHSTCAAVLRCRPGEPCLAPTGLSPAVARCSKRFGYARLLCNSAPVRQAGRTVLQPRTDIGLPPTQSLRFRLFRVRSPLLAESLRFPFLRVLRCFSSPTCLRPPMDSENDHQASPWWGCPIRTSTDHRLLTAPRGFSQPATSFFGPRCQGIHHHPFLAQRPGPLRPATSAGLCSTLYCLITVPSSGTSRDAPLMVIR